MNKKTLSDLRQQIDAVDRQLLDFISERAKLAQQIAQVKAQSGEGGLYYRPDREASVLKSVLEHNQGPLSDEEMARLIREVMSACFGARAKIASGIFRSIRNLY